MSKGQKEFMRFVGVYWTPEFVAKIDQIAKQENRSRSNTMQTLIQQQMILRDAIEKEYGRGASPTKHSANDTNTAETPMKEFYPTKELDIYG